MNRKIKILLYTVLLTFFCITSISTTTDIYAASADITLYSSVYECHPGDTFTIYIEIEAEVLPGDFEGSLIYPEEIIEYVSGPRLVSGGGGRLSIYDHETAPDRNNRKYALKFKALKKGNARVYLSGPVDPDLDSSESYDDDPELYEFEEGYRMSISCNDLEISVVSSKKISDDSSLAVLKVNQSKLEPAFSPDILEYRTEVSENTESLAVGAAAADRAASVEIYGNEQLKIGENRIEIIVTAENGDRRTYVINCFRREAENSGSTDNESFHNNESGSVEDKPSEDKSSYDSGNKEDDILPDRVKDDSEKESAVEEKQKNESTEALELAASYDKSLTTLTLIIAALCAVIMGLMIITIMLAIRNRQMKKQISKGE